jgi:S-adenosylmethionine synthetase
MSLEGVHLETAESVLEGHPDKIADQISDRIVDAALSNDPFARISCNTLVTHNTVVVAGEISEGLSLDVDGIVRQTLKSIGYDSESGGIDPTSCVVQTYLRPQASELASLAARVLPGDQAVTFGYAVDETSQLMPLPITLAQHLAKQISNLRRGGRLNYLRPDGKVQITVEYAGAVARRVTDVVISVNRSPDVDDSRLRHDLYNLAVLKIIPKKLIDKRTVTFINYKDKFIVGGPEADSGLTGRKNQVDAYGPRMVHGGGALSGKDPSKVDRTGAYLARYIAKNIVAAGLSKECKVGLVFIKGLRSVRHFQLSTSSSTAIREPALKRLLLKELKLEFGVAIEKLNLRRPIYAKTSVFGHFGRDEPEFTWEKTDLATRLDC